VSGSTEDSRSSWDAGAGESSLSDSERRTLCRLERGEGVFAGDDFCGEMDRARSREQRSNGSGDYSHGTAAAAAAARQEFVGGKVQIMGHRRLPAA
jgi:hypothetical protein